MVKRQRLFLIGRFHHRSQQPRLRLPSHLITHNTVTHFIVLMRYVFVFLHLLQPLLIVFVYYTLLLPMQLTSVVVKGVDGLECYGQHHYRVFTHQRHMPTNAIL